MGQALVEFALVVPILFMLIFAIIDFGRYVYYVQVLNNAAREGARYAIVHGHDSLDPSGPPDEATGANVKAAVRGFAFGVVGTNTDLVVTPSWPDGNNSRESSVTVRVTYQFRSAIPVIPIPAIQLEGTSTLVINH